MTTNIFEKKLWFRFFISINKTDDVWSNKGKIVKFRIHCQKDKNTNAWSIGLVTNKVYSLFGRY